MKETRAPSIERSFTCSPKFENDLLLQPPYIPSHILYTHTYTMLQNKIIYILITNTSHKTNSRKIRRRAGVI